MAKIALFTQTMSAQAVGLAQALQFHRHEVIMITSAKEPVPDGLGFQVLTYFKNWSAMEALLFFPRIMSYAPEVWHFVFSDMDAETPSPAHWVLSRLARALPARVIACSFYDNLYEVPRRKALPLLKNCDIVTAATRESLMYIKRKSWLGRSCETEVLPPFMTFNSTQEKLDLNPDLKQLIEAASPYLVVANEHLPDLDWDPVLGKLQLLVCGDRPEKSQDRVYYIGSNLTDSQLLEVLRHSKGLLTAFDDFSVVEMLRLHNLCSQTETPVLGSSRQAEALPGFCVPKHNGFLISGVESLNQLLQDNPRLEVPHPLFVAIKSDLADSALNELNRLYSKIRHLKSSSIDFKRGPIP